MDDAADDDIEVSQHDRLDRIATRWSLVRRAHDGTHTTIGDARRELVMRYSTAIRRYVRAIMRDEAEADEVAQDAVVRMLEGNFGGADPDRGRFRDLLKTAVRNMVRNRWRREGLRRGVDLDVQHVETSETDSPGEADDAEWLSSWRRATLDLAWSALEDYERNNPGSIDYTLLRLRSERPDDTSDELARRLSQRTGSEIRADALRQKLRRARRRFADFLLAEVADGLDQADGDAVEEELIALGLLEHVRDILPADWKSRIS
jgi:RNA polymerase sigma factor (sigma-70 family)